MCRDAWGPRRLKAAFPGRLLLRPETDPQGGRPGPHALPQSSAHSGDCVVLSRCAALFQSGGKASPGPISPLALGSPFRPVTDTTGCPGKKIEGKSDRNGAFRPIVCFPNNRKCSSEVPLRCPGVGVGLPACRSEQDRTWKPSLPMAAPCADLPGRDGAGEPGVLLSRCLCASCSLSVLLLISRTWI